MTIADPPSTIVDVPAIVAAPAVSARDLRTAPVRRAPARPTRLETSAERVLLVVAASTAVLAAALRFVGPKGLWLDEALTVNIARLPIPKLFEALRHDGSPPGYYVLLHYWMGLFGTGTWTVRALAGVLSVATLPVAWALGKAIGGRRVAVALAVVVACNPFALRYATENRMYSMVMLLATGLALTLVRLLQRPTFVRLVGFGVIAGLLLLTHYWALYLIAALGGLLFLASLRGPIRSRARLALVALCGGGLLFLPWAPSFAFQAQHTGTPWSAPASPSMIITTLGNFAGWQDVSGSILFWIFVASLGVAAVAVISVTWSRAGTVARWAGWQRPVPGSRWAAPVAALVVVTMSVALVGGIVASAAFAVRYASVVLPTVALLVAMGIVAVGRSRAGVVAAAVVLTVVAVLGTAAGAAESLDQRTQATVVAAQLRANAAPGDVIAYCPDQLGPAVSRLLPGGLYTQLTFPRWDDPSRINWVDYAQVNEGANPAVFSRWLLNLAGGHQVWLVWEAGYRTFGRSCQQILLKLELARPDFSEPVRSDPRRFYEHESLVRFPTT